VGLENYYIIKYTNFFKLNKTSYNMYRAVNIGSEVRGEQLEAALISAAKELGLKTVSRDDYNKQYRFGSGPDGSWSHQETVYVGTRVRLKGRIFPIAEIRGIRRGQTRDCFLVSTWLNSTPPFFCVGSEAQIERYLKVVSRNLLRLQINP